MISQKRTSTWTASPLEWTISWEEILWIKIWIIDDIFYEVPNLIHILQTWNIPEIGLQESRQHGASPAKDRTHHTAAHHHDQQDDDHRQGAIFQQQVQAVAEIFGAVAVDTVLDPRRQRAVQVAQYFADRHGDVLGRLFADPEHPELHRRPRLARPHLHGRAEDGGAVREERGVAGSTLVTEREGGAHQGDAEADGTNRATASRADS